MTDSVRSELFGVKSSSKTFQLTIKTKIEYDVDPFGDDANEDVQQPVAYSLAEGGPQRITVVSQSAKGFSKRALMEQNEAARMSVYAVKTPEQDFLDHDQTFIDPIFDDDHEEEFQNEDGALNTFLDQVNEKFSSDAIQSEANEEVLREKCRDAVMAVFEAQKIYYTAFYKTQSLNRFLRELLVKYNQKYRIIFKKYNRLREQFETNGMKKNITALNTDENKRIVAAMEQSLSELEIYRKLFKVAHDEDEYQRFKAELPGKAERQRSLLTKIVKGINDNHSNSVPEEQKLSLNYVVGKYKLQDETSNHEENADDSGNNTDHHEEEQQEEQVNEQHKEEPEPVQQEEAEGGNEEANEEPQEEPQEEAQEEGGETVEVDA